MSGGGARGRKRVWLALLAAALAVPVGIAGQRVGPNRDAPDSQAAESLLAARVAEYLDRIETYGYAGAVLVGSGNRVLHASGYGLADRELGRPYTTGTVFSVGSVTKIYTATLVLRLVDRGALELSDTLGEFYPDVPDDRAGITIEHLLTHTSGLGESPLRDRDPVTREEIEREAFTLPLVGEVGGEFRYSNLGFSLLGAIVERVTGREYEEVLREEVLVPSGAWETGYVLAPWGPGRLAQGYEGAMRWGTVVELFSDELGGPGWILKANGGLHSTVFDVFRWTRAIREGRLLSPELTEAFLTPRIHRTERSGEALGWAWERGGDGSLIIRHAGSNGIHSSEVRLLMDRDLTIIVSYNAGEDAPAVAATLTRIALGQPYVLPPAVDVIPVGATRRSELTGRWSTEAGAFRVTDLGVVLGIELESQELLGRALLLTADETARLERTTRRSRELVERALEGDFALPALERLWDGLEERFGPISRVEVLGTAPLRRGSAPVTWLRFRFPDADGNAVRRLHWSEAGELVGIGGPAYPAPLSLKCAATGPRRCTAAHLRLETTPVEFEAGPSGRGILRIGGRALDAVRVEAGS